jgi:DNA ligase (NAD+)
MPTKTPTTITSHKDFVALVTRLSEAAATYYASSGIQLMDDASYDAGIRLLSTATAAHPEWTEADDLLNSVAAGTAQGDVPHATPMLSLDNAMDVDEQSAFLARVAKLSGKSENKIAWSVEPKLDGMALSVRYVKGKLQHIVTRGNGRAGEDVTTAARKAKGILAVLPEPWTAEVRGECILSHADFVVANEERTENGKLPFANPRNAVAGTLRSIHRTYSVPLTFLAYGLVSNEAVKKGLNRHSAQMKYLESIGFSTARSVAMPAAKSLGTGSAFVNQTIVAIEAKRSVLDFDIDGAVVKADTPDVREACGENSRAPRWAIARKFAPDTRETDLLDIEAAVGRTGNLSFTAKLAPVAVGGVTVVSATVHNPSEIAKKGLRLPVGKGKPQRVWVRRAGDVIPEVVGPVDDNIKGTAPYAPPGTCPRCAGALDKSGLIWRCARGRACAIDAGIRYAVERDCLDLAFADRTVSALVESGRVADVADLFTLTVDDLLAIERMGEKNAAKIVESIDRARQLPLSRIFCSLGITMTGRSMSRRLAGHFGTLKALRNATVEDFMAVDGVGTERAASIIDELTELAPVLDRLEKMGVGLIEPKSTTTVTPLKGEIVVVSGVVPGLSRTEAQAMVERLGGKSSSSVSAKTTLLVAGEGAGSKLAKAESLGVRIMTAEDFAELIASQLV